MVRERSSCKNWSSSKVITLARFPATGRAGFDIADQLHAHALTTSGVGRGYSTAGRVPIMTDRNGEVSWCTPSAVTVARKETRLAVAPSRQLHSTVQENARASGIRKSIGASKRARYRSSGRQPEGRTLEWRLPSADGQWPPAGAAAGNSLAFSWETGDLRSQACHGQQTVSQQKKTCDSAQFPRCIADSKEPR